ncbi:MAG TPA: hypothetical protein VLA90_02160 [Actinomycetota bacterium]|nr:hypothetical protein [Actinomycetota bacterium]
MARNPGLRPGSGGEDPLSAGWIATGAFAFAVAVSPAVVLALRRTTVGPLNAAAWIAIWGLFIPVFEHSYFGITEGLDALTSRPHARVHVLMGLVYWPLGAIGIAVVMWTLLREGRRVAWFLLLGVLVIGGGLELLFNGPIGLVFEHGFASDSRPEGMAMLAYPVAWVTALVIAYGPIFRPEELTAQRGRPSNAASHRRTFSPRSGT